MPRELRARTSRPNYTLVGATDGEEDRKTRASKGSLGEEDSESGFGSDPCDDDTNLDFSSAKEAPKRSSTSFSSRGSRPLSSRAGIRHKRPPKILSAQSSSSIMSAPRIAKMYSLPNPSVHHRHRAIPVFHRRETVERLNAPPMLFNPPDILPTNSMTSERSLTDRVSKAWGYNVGPGPVWNIMEDRSCFKEALGAEENPEYESCRRPRVHQAVTVKPGWTILDQHRAVRYLPTNTILTDDGQLQSPPPVSCYLGPYGHQTRVEMSMFDSHATSKYHPGDQAFVFNAGAPAWGADWCPIYSDDRPSRGYKHYLAIAPFPSRLHSPMIGAKVQRPAPSCLQIWGLQSEYVGGSQENYSCAGELKCEIVLCLDSGPAFDIKWCPLPSHDEWNQPSSREHPRKLGLLAGTFEDGSLSLYVVPDPEDVRSQSSDTISPIFVHLPEPLLRIELEETCCWSFDWANSETIAVGCTNGYVAVYDIGHAVRTGQVSNILPTHYISIHQSAVRALAWIRVPPMNASGVPSISEDPTILATGGYDGLECLTDIREPHGNIINRTRDVINSTTYSVFAGGPIMIDHDNTVKAYSISPSTLGRGHVVMTPDGPVWSVSASDYHPQLAVGSADGSCLTTNTLKSTRRGTVPFFVHKIFQLDYNRNTGEFRMLDHFLPQETGEDSTSLKAKRAKNSEAEATISTGVWPPEVGVQRVTWNTGNGLSGAPLLASTTGSGLCRVDWLPGRWIRDTVPYVNVPNMRKEVDDIMDEDSGED